MLKYGLKEMVGNQDSNISDEDIDAILQKGVVCLFLLFLWFCLFCVRRGVVVWVLATGVEESVRAPKIVPFSSYYSSLFICFLMIVYVGNL